MSVDPGWLIWDVAGGAPDYTQRNAFERRVLAVWDAAVEAGRDDVADMAQREREWLYSSAYTPDAARERVETLEFAAAAMLGPTTPAPTTPAPKRPATAPPKTPTSTPPAPVVPAVKQASSSTMVWALGIGAVGVAIYFATRGR